MRLALTFDDGPGRASEELYDVLRAYGCQATFFVLGQNLQSCWWSEEPTVDPKQILVRAVKEGHLLGNHTMTHDGRSPLKQLVDEIRECDSLIKEIYSLAGEEAPNPIPFRLPYGIRAYVCEYMEGGRPRQGAALDNRLQALASVGRTHLHWTCLLPDWQAQTEKDADRLYEMAIDHVFQMNEQGLDAVLTMHDGRQKNSDDPISERSFTPQIVDRLLAEARKRRWDIVRVPEVGF